MPCSFTEKHNERSKLSKSVASLYLCPSRTLLLDSKEAIAMHGHLLRSTVGTVSFVYALGRKCQL